jgi:DNA-binding MarR family transcriptional regulator
MAGSDSTDRILSSWVAHWPELDVSGRHVIWRIQLIAKHLHQVIGEMAMDDAGISASGASLLMHLRVLPPPHRATPTFLGQRMSLTSGAMTSLVDRLEAEGYVTRQPDPDDRRGVLVTLTPSGIEIANELHEAYMRLELHLLQALRRDEREQLARLLRKLTASFEEELGAPA